MPVATYRHDGYSTYANPATPWIKQLDRPRADAVWAAVVPMIMTFWYTNNQSYAVTAARLLRTFYLNNSTRMNPNLNHAVDEPGSQACNDGLTGAAQFKSCGWGGEHDRLQAPRTAKLRCSD